jgi:hypothetical protein
MTHFNGRPRGGERSEDWDDLADPFVFWDGAYVLGSLSSNERREYEAHLTGCPSCRAAVSELSGMPALLALLDRDEVVALDANQPELPPLRPELLESLLAKVKRQRRRFRLVAGSALAAAAAVLAIGLVLAVRPGLTEPVMSPQASASAMTLASVAPSSLEATMKLTPHGWGTSVEMTCTYHEELGDADDHDDDAGDKLEMVAVGRDGSHTEMATWMALPGVTAQPGGSTSMPIDEIVAVQVVSSDSGTVLLQRTL